jgi:hypothetical protein
MGPGCSLDAAVMAESVDGERVDPSVGSATTSVDCARCCCCWWNAPIGGRKGEDLCANLVEEAAVRRRDIMVRLRGMLQIEIQKDVFGQKSGGRRAARLHH